MEKKSYIYPGTVFTAKNYDPFTKKILTHPFVCVYNQALDQNLNGETNILALLITSNSKQLSRQIPILKSKNNFLDKDSYCYSNNIYMFLKEDVTIIGQLDSDTFFDIVQKRQLMLRGENDQCVQSLMNMKAYESKIAKEETNSHCNNPSNKKVVQQCSSANTNKKNDERKDDNNNNKFLSESHDFSKVKSDEKRDLPAKNKKKKAKNNSKNNKKSQTNKTNTNHQQKTQKTQSHKFKKPNDGPVIIGEPNQRNFANMPQKTKKHHVFFRNKKRDNVDKKASSYPVDRGYIES